MNGLKLMSKKVVAVFLTILLLAAPLSGPLFLDETEAAEIGMVGALDGSVTLWEIFQTIFAAAGIIVANDNIQNAAALNLGSSAYTLEEMESLGFIRVPTDGSSALDWDWSGLENQLENDTSEDTKIIRNVFGQDGGQGSGGDNQDPDEDPWYKKAVNWVKNAVVNGKIRLTEEFSNGAESVSFSLTALAGMLGAAYSDNVKMGVPVNKPITIKLTGLFGYNYGYNSQSVYIEEYWFASGMNSNSKLLTVETRSRPTQNWSGFIIGRDVNGVVLTKRVYRDGVESSNTNYTSNEFNHQFASGNISNVPANGSFNFDNIIKYSGTSAEYNNIKNEFWNNQLEGITNKSPDIMTPAGYGQIPQGVPSWVPTPYLAPNKEMEIIPQPKIDEFTQYVIEEVPQFEPAGEAWKETVNPYIQDEPVPTPTVRPMPTQRPDVTGIPSGDPGGEDNPINVVNPDPMPVIEGGFATTYGLMDFFPFCIPSDIVTIYKLFETDEDARAAPYIDWNIKIERFGIDEHLILDFSMFDSSAAVCRVLMFITFCLGLLLATKQIIWS